MEILTWEEFIVQKARFDCPDCPKIRVEKDKPKPRLCIPCVQCYGDFRSWDRTHRDSMLLDELRAKINARSK